MIQINQLRLAVGHSEEQLKAKLCRALRIPPERLLSYEIGKQSIDARKKPDIFYSYQMLVSVEDERRVLAALKHDGNISAAHRERYVFPPCGSGVLKEPPVVVGSGPAGLFCAYLLALHGYRPLLLERGEAVEERQRAVERFWKTGQLDPKSNVQFGEGGAGTFSDGKLNTLVKDKGGRNRLVLETFVRFGAPPDILYRNKPHLGTDLLTGIVRAMREEIIRLGGQVRFCTRLTGIKTAGGVVRGAVVNGGEIIPAEALILAVGHSARDTFAMLEELGVLMEPKAFAVGIRIEHPQGLIDESQYGSFNTGLPAADYKLTANLSGGRSVYSFCMCPGGYVVNASSEPGRLAVNGMSYQARDGKNANSALVVTVTPADYGGSGPLSGVAYQRRLEELAYSSAGGHIPVQLYGDFQAGRVSGGFGAIKPAMKGEYAFGDLRQVLPAAVSEALAEAMPLFGRKIKGYDRPDAILSAVESRTSSPVRILRDECYESSLKGLYPCGEGAGYAGGITSAAMDGIRMAEKLAARYRPGQRAVQSEMEGKEKDR